MFVGYLILQYQLQKLRKC